MWTSTHTSQNTILHALFYLKNNIKISINLNSPEFTVCNHPYCFLLWPRCYTFIYLELKSCHGVTVPSVQYAFTLKNWMGCWMMNRELALLCLIICIYIYVCIYTLVSSHIHHLFAGGWILNCYIASLRSLFAVYSAHLTYKWMVDVWRDTIPGYYLFH